MKKFILAATAVAFSASTAFAGSIAAGEEEDDPFVPVAAASSSAGLGGVGTALAVVGGLVVIGALANSESSTGSD